MNMNLAENTLVLEKEKKAALEIENLKSKTKNFWNLGVVGRINKENKESVNIQVLYSKLLKEKKINDFESDDWFDITPDDFTFLHLKYLEFKNTKELTFAELSSIFHHMAVKYMINFDRLWYEVTQKDLPRLSAEDYKEVYRIRQELNNNEKATFILDNSVVQLSRKELRHFRKLLATFEAE